MAKLSDYDTLECPFCDNLTNPKKENSNGSVTYKCEDCENVFTIDINGDLIE